ncbi:MAG: glutamate--tRNA ligase [Pseudomonadales bacterium]|nr:glutamate--tRNA ligase [Pseudomonadales bacterium]
MKNIVRTRIAPSPTGIAHIGTAWMSMFDMAFARQNNGQFVLRIEDTDRGRFVEEAEEKIYEGLAWLGIEYDEGGKKGGPYTPYHQSERLDIYRKYVDQLIENGQAYYCFATKEELDEMRRHQIERGELPRYDKRWFGVDPELVKNNLDAGKPYVIRLNVPKDKIIAWDDVIRGKIEFDSNLIDDQILLKSDGFPTYHLAVVVDDHLMKISHVLRGEEWISSTPKHILLYDAFGWEPPRFAHMPLIRNIDHSKLSKRKNDVSILSYRDNGYLPEAVLNFIALLGWSHPEGKDIFSFKEFLKTMTLDRVQKTGPVFDIDKLNWYNGVYIRKIVEEGSIEKLTELLESEGFIPSDMPKEIIAEVLSLVYERMVTLKDFEELTEFFYRDIKIDVNLLTKKANRELVDEQLEKTINTLKDTAPDVENFEKTIREVCEKNDYKKGQYFMMLRIAVTGKQATPPLFETMIALTKKKTLERLDGARKSMIINTTESL